MNFPVVHIVDDEETFARSLLLLLEDYGFSGWHYAHATAYLQKLPALTAEGGCLLLDIRMPGMSGLELQRRLKEAGHPFPIIFMTGHGDVELAVQAMKQGAVDFLQKPFREQSLMDAVAMAVRISQETVRRQCQQKQASERLERLSQREKDVARLLALGYATKEVAKALSISANTVHVHRQHITDKIGTGHAADLARLFLQADPDSLDQT